ncbi:MAG TPA: hypothetical protein VJQ45_00995, partial [Ktedonobacterales bacterium]|nr:hypothetical protein [Ktedonobacterales bacterium]
VRRRAYRAAARGLVLGMVLTALALAAASGSPSLASAHPQDTPTISIAIPAPNSNGVAQGPVGANLTINGSGFTDGHTYQLGYVPQSQGCGTSGSTLPTFANGSVTTSGGSFSATVQWPAGAANVDGRYYICVTDTTDTTVPPVQSSDLFRVVAANAPQFKLVDPSTSAPLQGPPYLLYIGSPVTISGQNFAPGGLTLLVYLSQQPIKSGSDFDSATLLSTTNRTAITTQDTGAVTATIQIPAGVSAGSYNLYLVSSDRQGASLPSLMDSVQATLAQQPTATPKPSPTATPKATPPPSEHSSTGPGLGRTLGVVGLSLLSLLLLIAGVLLLAGGGPRRMP